MQLGLGAKKFKIKNNYFNDISSSAIQISGINKNFYSPARGSVVKNNLVANNYISNIAVDYQDAPAIFLGFAANNQIINNRITDVPWSGIAVGWGWGLLDPDGFPGLVGAKRYQWGKHGPTPNRNNLIAGNKISNFLESLWDGGAIYTTGYQGTSIENGLVISGNKAWNRNPNLGGNTFYTDGGSRFITVKNNSSYNNPIGKMFLGPPPNPKDPLPYSKTPSEANGLPYGSDSGGCVTYGDIRFIGNRWLQDPMSDDMLLANDLYAIISGGKIKPYSPQGFFDVCPFSQDGKNYPVNLFYQDNTIIK